MIDMAGCRRHGHMLFPGAATSPRLALLLMPVAIRARSGPSSLLSPRQKGLSTPSFMVCSLFGSMPLVETLFTRGIMH